MSSYGHAKPFKNQIFLSGAHNKRSNGNPLGEENNFLIPVYASLHHQN